MTAERLTIALGEYDTGWHEPKASLAAAARLAQRAAAVGVDVVVFPEMTTTGFTMDTARAVPVDSPDIAALRRIASQNQIWVIAGVALEEDPSGTHATNAALAIGPDGEIEAVHRKQKLFAYAGEERSYVAGGESTTIAIRGVRIGLFICYELRFSEVFASAVDIDAAVVIANWPAARTEHWDALLRARAIEFQCYALGVNRTGVANGLAYSGGSTAFDPWGNRLTPATPNGTRVVGIDANRVAEVRQAYPFLRDRADTNRFVTSAGA